MDAKTKKLFDEAALDWGYQQSEVSEGYEAEVALVIILWKLKKEKLSAKEKKNS